MSSCLGGEPPLLRLRVRGAFLAKLVDEGLEVAVAHLTKILGQFRATDEPPIALPPSRGMTILATYGSAAAGAGAEPEDSAIFDSGPFASGR